MISDDHIIFYFLGLILIIPVLIGVVYSLLRFFGVDNALLYAAIGTPLVLWFAAWVFNFVDDVNGHIS